MSIIAIAPPMFRSRVIPLACTYAGGAGFSGSPPYTVSSIDFGAPSPARYGLVTVCCNATATITSVTVLGVAATVLKTQPSGNYERQYMWIAKIPTGSVGNVVVGFTAGVSGTVSVDAHRIDGLASKTLIDSEAVGSLTTQNYTNTGIVVPAGDHVVVACRSAVMTGTYTWSGLTENVDGARGSASYTRSLASGLFTTPQNPLSVGVNMSGTASQGSFIAVCLKGGEPLPPMYTAKEAVDTLSIGANLVMCLDAGDANCTNGTAQQWSDVSGANNHYNRGTYSFAESNDPTFNGSAGGLSNAYWSFDGADVFAPVAATSFDDGWHKDNAAVTVAAFAFLPAAGVVGNNPVILCNSDPTSPGIFFQLNVNDIQWTVRDASAWTDYSGGDVSALFGKWGFYGVSINEAGGASASHWNVNGVITPFNGAYPAPSANNPAGSLHIGRRINDGQFLANGTRLGLVVAWNRALSQAELENFRAALANRFPTA